MSGVRTVAQLDVMLLQTIEYLFKRVLAVDEDFSL